MASVLENCLKEVIDGMEAEQQFAMYVSAVIIDRMKQGGWDYRMVGVYFLVAVKEAAPDKVAKYVISRELSKLYDSIKADPCYMAKQDVPLLIQEFKKCYFPEQRVNRDNIFDRCG